MLDEKDGLFKNGNVKFYSIDCSRICWDKPASSNALTDSINKNMEVAGLLTLTMGDHWVLGKSRYSPRFIVGILCLTRKLLINQLGLFFKCNKGAIRREILNGVINSKESKKRILELPLETTAKDVFNCLKKGYNSGFYFNDKATVKFNIKQIYISYDKLYRILSAIEKNEHNVKIINYAIREIDEVLNTVINDPGLLDTRRFGDAEITAYDYSDDIFKVKNREQVIKGIVEGDAMEDTTQTLTLNRPKQQENKIITTGNKKAYTFGKGDYQHRHGVIKEEKAEMNKVYTYPVGDKNILADLEDLLNNIIDNPDTVDNLVNYLEKNAPAAHFISEMIGCGEVDSEESLIGALNKATSLSQGIVCAGKNVNVQGGEYKVFNYLNIDYPKPIFGREFSLKQLSFCFDVAAREIEDIFVKAREEEEAEEEAFEEIIADAAQAQAKEIEDILDGVEAEEEKEEVIANDDVQECAEEDDAACDEYPTDLAELEKLLEERRKEVADLTVEVKQAEEEARRRELLNELIALDKQKAELNARKAELNKK